jgi:hypothetical protein
MQAPISSVRLGSAALMRELRDAKMARDLRDA